LKNLAWLPFHFIPACHKYRAYFVALATLEKLRATKAMLTVVCLIVNAACTAGTGYPCSSGQEGYLNGK